MMTSTAKVVSCLMAQVWFPTATIWQLKLLAMNIEYKMNIGFVISAN